MSAHSHDAAVLALDALIEAADKLRNQIAGLSRNQDRHTILANQCAIAPRVRALPEIVTNAFAACGEVGMPGDVEVSDRIGMRNAIDDAKADMFGAGWSTFKAGIEPRAPQHTCPDFIRDRSLEVTL
ncbi:hypothetical protein [Antarcticirhabdus aurantiaca]|uniref:Uncharacterized protein n=1 Tax=Antarcticirhabdus aurantiaca TaxID=2606717 RepID=A0ACD4NLB3_9HYPH|nr:hypothetical protein OXU80_22460 [Jeongeuplla avenae]